MSPELSVVIPTFKRSDSLKQLLQILSSQQMIKIEVLVIDQNPEGYFDNELQQLLEQVKWIRQDKPNASAARNKGFKFSTAEYILFIDDDLIPQSDFCRKGLDIFLQFPDIECFSPLVYTMEGEAKALAAAKAKYLEHLPGNDSIFSVSDTISAAIFFRKKYYLQSGGFDELLFEFAKTAEDQEFFLRMQRNGMKLWYVPTVTVFHDEKVAGGCDLRTADYWVTREKCMRAWALSYRKNSKGRIALSDSFKLFRSCVLNLQAIRSSPAYIARQMSLMIKAKRDSQIYFSQKRDEYMARIENGFLSSNNIVKNLITVSTSKE